MINYDNENPLDAKPVKKARAKLKKCKICRDTVTSDGYGDLVHADSGKYFAPDPKGDLDHAAV